MFAGLLCCLLLSDGAVAELPQGVLGRGIQLYFDAQLDEALETLLPLAEDGDATAQFYVGAILYLEFYEGSDKTAALDWFVRSSDKGNLYGSVAVVAEIVLSEDGPDIRIDPYIPDLHRLVDSGEAEAHAHLAGAYMVVEGPTARVVEHLKAAVAAGVSVVPATLGAFYEIGLHVPYDREKALKFYRISAKNGYDIAQFHLGKLLLDIDTEAYFDEGLMWILLASNQGYDDATELWDRYQSSISADQDATIVNASEEWYSQALSLGDSDFARAFMWCKNNVPATDKLSCRNLALNHDSECSDIYFMASHIEDIMTTKLYSICRYYFWNIR